MRWTVAIALAALLPARAWALDCERDDALSRAAAGLLAEGEPLTPAAIERAVRSGGSDLPAVHALRDPRMDDDRLAAWLAGLRDRVDAPLVCGEAQGDGGRLVLAASRAGGLEVDEAERRVRGELAPGFDRPELIVRDASGALERVGLDAELLRDGVRLSEELPLPAVVQLVAHGPHGPVPVAERTVGSTGARTTTMVGDSDPRTRLAHLRELRGAGELRENRLLAAEASRHARRVCAERRVAHTLEAGQDPERRLARRGIRARLVGEVVARASSPGAAMDALVRSPSHHLTLVERRFTDAGIGSAADDGGHTCLVVLLAAWPRYLGAAASR